MLRKHIPTSEEIVDLLLADAALTIGFSLALRGSGISPLACVGSGSIMKILCSNPFLFYLPIAFVAVSLSFILHEYMHKIAAQHYGAIAGFKRSDFGIIIAILSGFLGFLIGWVGATWIYTSTFTKRENGITSLAGPLTNFTVFLVFLALSFFISSGYAAAIISTTLFISLWLAVFNMLPIPPLDGSKVLAWNAPIYAITFLGLVALLILVLFGFLP
jgi:Zn-dependent protease